MNDENINNLIAYYWCRADLKNVLGARLTLSKADIEASERIEGNKYDSDFGLCELEEKEGGEPEFIFFMRK